MSLGKISLKKGLKYAFFLPLGIEPNYTTTLNQGALIEEPMFNETSGYVAMMSGFVIAPYTGDFEFYVAASDKVALFISNTTNVNDASLISSSSGPLSPDTYGEKSMSMFLEGNGLLSYLILWFYT